MRNENIPRDFHIETLAILGNDMAEMKKKMHKSQYSYVRINSHQVEMKKKKYLKFLQSQFRPERRLRYSCQQSAVPRQVQFTSITGEEQNSYTCSHNFIPYISK
jgi:hypothetical protein